MDARTWPQCSTESNPIMKIVTTDVCPVVNNLYTDTLLYRVFVHSEKESWKSTYDNPQLQQSN